MISKSLEEYLMTMYVIKMKKNDVRVTDIANKMNYSKPSVNKALYNLKDNGLIEYESYGKIVLTNEGEELAKKLLEAYDIVFIFLKEVLGLDEESAKNDAEKMKSSLSDKSLNELAKYVHKELGLNSNGCDYNLNNEKCRRCTKLIKEKAKSK